jgi:hypothetical protein
MAQPEQKPCALLFVHCVRELQGRLWKNRGAIHYTTILQRKAGRMIWARDAISYTFTFGKRSAKVGARVSHGEDTVSATNQQNRQALLHRFCAQEKA